MGGGKGESEGMKRKVSGCQVLEHVLYLVQFFTLSHLQFFKIPMFGNGMIYFTVL